VRRFPYKLFYRLEHERVIVFRILHARRDHPQFLRPENS
jgi:plasmid stabilization system protein ParE